MIMMMLKDAEIIAARNTAAHIEVRRRTLMMFAICYNLLVIILFQHENKTLRNALEGFQVTMNDLHAKFENTLLLAEAQNQVQVDDILRSHNAVLREKESIIEQMSLESVENRNRIQSITAQYRSITLARREGEGGDSPLPVNNRMAPSTPVAAAKVCLMFIKIVCS